MELPAPFGKYHLLQRLAVGGMAEVFLAKAFGAAGFERILVIKKILPHMSEDEEFITMFIDEARIASTLNHSNIIQITELGREDKDYYIAMEYTMGQDLSRVHQKLTHQKRTTPIPIAVLIASRICEGLEYAHRKKDSSGKSLDIIHRDVSPGNILVSYDGDVKIIDFGIAKAQNRMGRTTAGTLKGKFGYMSPEQVRGHGLDHRSDIFSVGILLYEMLTNERLFGAESDFGTLEKVRNAIVVPPTTYNSKIPAELERVVMQSLAREPEERYEWASDMQEDLVRFLMTEGSLTTSKSLGLFMRELFRKELEKENERLSVFRKRGYPWADAAKEENEQSAPDTTEMPAVEAEPEPEPPDMSDEYEEEDTGEVEIIEGSRGGYKVPQEDKFAQAADDGPVDLSRRGGGEDNAATQIFMSRDLATEEEQAGPVVVGEGMGDYDPTGQYDDLTPGTDGEQEGEPEASVEVPDLTPQSEGNYEPTASLSDMASGLDEEEEEEEVTSEASDDVPDLAPESDGDYDPTGSIPDLSPPPDGVVDGQVHQPTMIMEASALEETPPAEDEKPLPREPSQSGRSRGKNKSLQKRPPRKRPASTGTEALGGRKGRPGPLTGPEPKPEPAPKKKKSAALGIVATFVGGLCLAGLIGYFMFVYKGDTPGETVPDKPGQLTKPVTGPDKNGPPSDVLVDDKPPPTDGGSLAGFGVEPDPEPPAAPDGGEVDGAAAVAAATDGGAEDPPPADGEAGLAQPEDPKPEDPKPEDPKPEDPKPVDPKPVDPKPEDAKPADPKPAEVKKTDPKPSQTKKKKKRKKKRVAKLSGCELKVVSTPSGASILLNGKASGKTPKTFRGLDPKKNYFVVLRKDGYKKHFEGVKFKGKKKAAVKAALKSSGSKSKATAAKDKKPATTSKGGKGYLVANTTPWAKVIIDGKDTGKWTPVVGKNKIALKSGRHVITFKTKEGKKLTVKVNIEPGKTAKVIKKIN